MDGLINFHKPVGITSAKALYKVRSITGERKSGHAGTLDPAASGVLVLCLGKATKLVETIMDHPKIYRASVRLDATSESYDCDRPLSPVEVPDPPDESAVRRALVEFEGHIQQVPPSISAVKVGGVPAYRRVGTAREVPLKPRPVMVYWLQLLRYEFPTLDFEACCGRGTYVRALVRDLGVRLSSGGVLTALVRTQVGPFPLTGSWTLDAIRTESAPDRYLVPLDLARHMLEKTSIPARSE